MRIIIDEIEIICNFTYFYFLRKLNFILCIKNNRTRNIQNMSSANTSNQESKALLEPMQIPESLSRYVLTRSKNYPGGFAVKTYSVFATNKKDKILKHGPDDQTYISHPDLVSLIPRGCSELYKSNDLKHPICTIYGLPKFDGTSVVDEDELPFEGASEEDSIP